MAQLVLAFDLGTSGCKAALYDANGVCRAEAHQGYATEYPHAGFAEQRPSDWWDAVVSTARDLRARAGASRRDVVAIALSGQSLAVVPVDSAGELVMDSCPIWSDARAGAQAAAFFGRVGDDRWYQATGNGFPPELYSAFKTVWLRDERPADFARTAAVAGSKDWVNMMLTGRLVTDHSYASGSGVYDLLAAGYDEDLIAAAGLPPALFPDVVPATEVVGGLTPRAAEALDLAAGTPVMAGGVDNSCMAVGAHNLGEGELYAALGSSSWLTVSGSRPVVDPRARPFVFASVVPGLYHSAVSTFGAGTSLQWVRENVLGGMDDDAMFSLAKDSPPGARSLLFVPTLAGGTWLEGGPRVRGAYVGLDVRHTRSDLARSALEGVAFALRRALDALRELVPVGDRILVVGGGSKNAVARQLYADVFGVPVVKTSVDQQAATLGAAAVALVGAGLWSGFDRVRDVHEIVATNAPDAERAQRYDELLPAFLAAATAQERLAELLAPD